jgi:hypothetical protein
MSEPRRFPVLLPAPRVIELTAGVCDAAVAPIVHLDPQAVEHPQGYQLIIDRAATRIVAHDPAGVFYATQTLAQLRRTCGRTIPCLRITDWPDFSVRGVMLDISRDKVPTMATLFSLVDRLAEWKFNQLQLYMEHTFAYRNHPVVWANASPMTGEEIQSLDRYCKDRFIELVPNQNSFGHMERWLKHPEYRHLAEAPEGSDMPSGVRWNGPFSLCPTDHGSIELLAGLYDELLPNFSSRLFNVGCDETFDIGQGRSREIVAQRGKGRVYLDFLTAVDRLVSDRGRRMMFWGDIILDSPELIDSLPRDAIAMQWGYEADHPFERDSERFARSGRAFYVCPGTSSWCSIAGRTDNAIANCRAAAEAGLRHGASGYLVTDWGDYGHLQYLPVSYAGFAAGAAASWCLEAGLGGRDIRGNASVFPAAELSAHAFEDSAEASAGALGRAACELGNIYLHTGKLITNGSSLFRILVPSAARKDPMEGMTRDGLDAAEEAIERAIIDRARWRPRAVDGETVVAEFINAANMLRHACRRGRWKLDKRAHRTDDLIDELAAIIAEHRRLWLVRNRPGGLEDSARRLEETMGDYSSGGDKYSAHM